ncbi:hypothetical protein BO83DRAFT_80938 [Aspergillus eucalypticola CBS 122712]|uniref:Uncharacterized protein n=1 Tax=Aspergillus eucalypticola (strain CBS 122712 / IBT 29274) TaxID=1448314 RepID=A0A317WFV6_ASPEC|nr:uncharacterized protein BO83DRAFT_80938 [Aspergillus eucalypticola CBS 122712]PWY84137.1 hypothetical protein BO83DRAFT_80938 [Aspergillus eucalypticola CBS 122712]
MNLSSLIPAKPSFKGMRLSNRKSKKREEQQKRGRGKKRSRHNVRHASTFSQPFLSRPSHGGAPFPFPPVGFCRLDSGILPTSIPPVVIYSKEGIWEPSVSMFYGASFAGRLPTRVPSDSRLVLITQKGFSGPTFRLAQQIVVGFDGGPECGPDLLLLVASTTPVLPWFHLNPKGLIA